MIKCSRLKCENFTKEKNLHPCDKCKKADAKFIKEDWSGFSNHLTKVFNKVIAEEERLPKFVQKDKDTISLHI